MIWSRNALNHLSNLVKSRYSKGVSSIHKRSSIASAKLKILTNLNIDCYHKASVLPYDTLSELLKLCKALYIRMLMYHIKFYKIKNLGWSIHSRLLSNGIKSSSVRDSEHQNLTYFQRGETQDENFPLKIEIIHKSLWN